MNREMKDSGFQTVGLIPNDWKPVRLKYLCSIETGNEDTQNADPEGAYPFYVRSPIIERCKRFTFDGEGILVAGDGAGAGRIFHHAYGKYAVHQRVYRLAEFTCFPTFLHYYLSNLFPYEMDKGSAQSTVPSMRLPMLQNFPVYMPQYSEQCHIANFLDNKCSQIDEISKKIQEEIDTLEEYKKSVITEAVTKGLDPNVEMKDSGIQALGKVPVSWNIVRLKYIADSIRKGTGITKEQVFLEGDTPCVRYGEIYSKYNISFNKCFSNTYKEKLGSLQWFGHGDILFAGTGELIEEIGKNIVYEGTNNCLAGGDIIIVSHSQDASFLNFALGSECSQKQKSAGKSKLKVVHISASEIGNIYVALPEIEEQRKIGKYLKEKCANVEKAISTKQQQLATLEEYKKSLIYEYVTGKKEVI